MVCECCMPPWMIELEIHGYRLLTRLDFIWQRISSLHHNQNKTGVLPTCTNYCPRSSVVNHLFVLLLRARCSLEKAAKYKREWWDWITGTSTNGRELNTLRCHSTLMWETQVHSKQVEASISKCKLRVAVSQQTYTSYYLQCYGVFAKNEVFNWTAVSSQWANPIHRWPVG